MKRLLACAVLFAALALADGAAQSELSIQVREAEMRSNPSYLSGIVTTLSYGDRVRVLEEGSGWYRVSFEGDTGWVHNSAVTEERIVLEGGQEDVETGATDTEVALAGRGFNEEVESRYQSEQGLDYSKIDEIEASYDFSREELAEFMQSGGLEIGQGGER